MTSAPGTTSPLKIIAIVVASMIAAGLLLVGGIAGYLWISGTPVIDEWSCSDGEAPVNYDEGGSNCKPEGATLEPNETWDPLGNRPLICTDRWGWTEIESTTQSDDTACLKNGRDIPDGWVAVQDD